MLIISPDQPVPETLRRGVVAIGNFDGVHQGHQQLFTTARAHAAQIGAPFIVLTFSPHPRAFFRPEGAPFLITPAEMKAEHIAQSDADGLVTLRFDRTLADHTPDAFMTEILRDHLDGRTIVVGTDFHFGHNRAGSIETLRAAGFEVLAVDPVLDPLGLPYSSTRVRAAIGLGDMALAHRLLGWDWEIRAAVVHGDKRGRTLGYPTANMVLDAVCAPAYGIYAGWVCVNSIAAPVWHRAALSFGRRPMFETSTPLLEAHLLDFNGDLYGRTLRVRLMQKLRDEMTFGGLETLIAQIATDCEQARAILTTPDA